MTGLTRRDRSASGVQGLKQALEDLLARLDEVGESGVNVQARDLKIRRDADGVLLSCVSACVELREPHGAADVGRIAMAGLRRFEAIGVADVDRGRLRFVQRLRDPSADALMTAINDLLNQQDVWTQLLASAWPGATTRFPAGRT